MTNIKLPPKSAEAFVAAAPDSRKARGVTVGNQRQITLAMPTELVDKVDAAARKLALSRASFIKQALAKAVSEE